MKKLIFILMVGSLFVGCMFIPNYSTEGFIYQDLSLSGKIRPDMTTAEVIEIMGIPVVSELDRTVETWHYCNAGNNSNDSFVAIYFVNNNVIAKHHYQTDGGFGSCEIFVTKGNYKIPPEVQKILDK